MERAGISLDLGRILFKLWEYAMNVKIRWELLVIGPKGHPTDSDKLFKLKKKTKKRRFSMNVLWCSKFIYENFTNTYYYVRNRQLSDKNIFWSQKATKYDFFSENLFSRSYLRLFQKADNSNRHLAVLYLKIMVHLYYVLDAWTHLNMKAEFKPFNLSTWSTS